MVPQALPGLITTAIFTFILAWNEYLYALVIVSRDARKTLPPGVTTTLVTGYNVEWGMVMAASVMMSLPLLAIFLLLQRHLVRGFGSRRAEGLRDGGDPRPPALRKVFADGSVARARARSRDRRRGSS